MAQYKVIQDIEAEDKLLGPLTLRQFIYAAIFFVLGFIAYKISSSLHSIYIVVVFLPPMAFFGLLAAPLGKDQPNEIWLLAKIKFYFKPQLRKWDQDGLSGLIKINVPKVVSKRLTKNFTGTEAKSRLENIAKILDSGGAPEIVPISTSFNKNDGSDRLVAFGINISSGTNIDPTSDSDIFSEDNFKTKRISSVLSDENQKLQNYKQSLLKDGPTPITSSDETLVNNTRISNIKGWSPSGATAEYSPSSFNPFVEQKEETKNTTGISTALNDKINLLARDNNRSIASIDRELKGGANSNGEVVINLH